VWLRFDLHFNAGAVTDLHFHNAVAAAPEMQVNRALAELDAAQLQLHP
jgi:hypothetical protein